ncbi:hypothetical protein GN956_G22031 [Arapaima gigas]
MPPRGFSGDQLQPLCHNLGSGRSFASLYDAARNFTVFSALCISKGWSHGESDSKPSYTLLFCFCLASCHVVRFQEDEGEETQKEGTTDLPALPLALLGDGTYTSGNSHTHIWDTVLLKFVHHSTIPWCHSMEGDLYVLTGAQLVAESQQGGEVSQFWSALCCSEADEKSKHGFGILKTPEDGIKVLSVGALEEVLGVSDLFPGRCGGPDGVGEDKSDTLAFLNSLTTELSTDTPAHTADGAEEQSTAEEPQPVTEEQTESAIISLISSSFSVLTAPFRPIVSTVTHIPSQVSYIVQEDVSILSSLPLDTFSVFYNIIADAAWGVMSAGGLLSATGKLCFSCIYCCTAPLVETLINTCTEGVTGVGTLAGDGVGIFGKIVENAWSVSRFIGGTAWEQSEGYLCAVFSELGSQVERMGGGLGKLVTKGGRGASNVVKVVGWMLGGSVDMVMDTAMEAFGKE